MKRKAYDKETQNNKISLGLTDNCFLPIINNNVRKHGNTLNIS